MIREASFTLTVRVLLPGLTRNVIPPETPVIGCLVLILFITELTRTTQPPSPEDAIMGFAVPAVLTLIPSFLNSTRVCGLTLQSRRQSVTQRIVSEQPE